MRASNHTLTMVQWWKDAGVDRADLAVRRPCGTMIWHHDISLASSRFARLLSWARSQNIRQADVYARPARVWPWPLVFLDDVSVRTASLVIRKYDALVIHTSEEGGCHLWLSCSRRLDEESRGHAQRWLAPRAVADLSSTSGEHLGRLAGFKNWKRGGCWVNVIDAAFRGRPWTPILDDRVSSTRRSTHRRAEHVDTSESGREWGWVCGMIETGYDPSSVYSRLVERARPRRGRDTERYARRTMARALDHVRQKGLRCAPR